MQYFEIIQDMLSEELGIAPKKITMDSRLVDDLNADSITLMVITGNIQEQFGIDIPDDAVKGIVTVSDIVEYLEKNV